MKDSRTNLRGEVPKKVFFLCVCVIAVVGKPLILTEKKELEVLPSLDHSLAHVRSLSVSARSLPRSGEREEEQSRKSGRRDLLKWTSFVLVCFLRCTARRCFINGVVDQWYLKRTFLDHQISHFLCEVPCLFFGGLFFPLSRIDFQKTNVMPLFRIPQQVLKPDRRGLLKLLIEGVSSICHV